MFASTNNLQTSCMKWWSIRLCTLIQFYYASLYFPYIRNWTSVYLKLESCSKWRVRGRGQSLHMSTSHKGMGARLQSLQPKFNFWSWGGGLTAVTAVQVQLHILGGPTAVTGGGGSDCSHCRATWLQSKFNFWSWESGVQLQSLQTIFTAVQFQLLILGGGVTADQLHCSPSSTSDPGGVRSNYNHCRPSSLQSKLNFWSLVGGGHCRPSSLQSNFNFWSGAGVWLQSLQTNLDFTHTLCPENWDLCTLQTFRAEYGLATSTLQK